MKITSSLQNLYPMWFSEVQMKYSIKHNLNKCQLGPALSPLLETFLSVHTVIEGRRQINNVPPYS